MYLNRIARDLQKNYGNLFEFKVENDRVTGTGELSIKGHDDNVYASIMISNSGSAMFRFCFDQVEPSEHVLNLINDLNDELFFLKAYIDSDNYLVLQHNTFYISELDYMRYVSRVLNELVDEDTERLLKPITQLTA